MIRGQLRVVSDSCADDMHPDFKKNFRIECFADYSPDKEAKTLTTVTAG